MPYVGYSHVMSLSFLGKTRPVTPCPAWILRIRKHNKGTVRTDDNGHETMMQCGDLGKKVLVEIVDPFCKVRTTGCNMEGKKRLGILPALLDDRDTGDLGKEGTQTKPLVRNDFVSPLRACPSSRERRKEGKEGRKQKTMA